MTRIMVFSLSVRKNEIDDVVRPLGMEDGRFLSSSLHVDFERLVHILCKIY